MKQNLTESKFYMWRALFAVAHADNVVSNEELRFMTEAMEDLPLCDEQERILREDIINPQDVIEMFKRITNPRHQAQFFKHAKELVWSDGEYDQKEQEMMLALGKEHLKSINLDNLVGKVDMEFEDVKPIKKTKPKMPPHQKKNGLLATLHSMKRAIWGE